MSALSLQAGKALYTFDDQGQASVWARMIYVTDSWIYLMEPSAIDEDGFVDWYVPAPFRHRHEQLIQQIDARHLRIAEFKGPPRWYWTEQDLENMRRGMGPAGEDATDKGLGTKGDRRDVAAWISDRDLNWSYIEPLFKQYSITEVLETGVYKTWPREQAVAIGVAPRIVTRAVRLYLFSLGQLGALMPARDRQGGAGKEKFSKVLTGRKADDPRADGSRGFISTPDDRMEMAESWKKFKTKGTSVEVARLRALTEHRAESITQDGPNTIVKLRPEGELWSISQFRRFGPRGPDSLSATAINDGENPSRPAHARRAKTGSLVPHRVALVGQIDATPADFYPVSIASRLQTLCKPWRTELTDEELGYTFGLYVGFEHSSNFTALLTVLNAAEDHVAFCAEFGIKIEPWQWHSRLIRRIKADNGEMKAANAFCALEEMEQTGEFCRPYAWEDKALVESRHRTRQVAVDHQIAGTDQGRRHDRGASNPKMNAAVNLREYMPQIIKNILWKNNEERVEHLLTVEMRMAGVKPFRGDIYRWCLTKGYVSEEPMDLTSLRARCLPSIKAKLHPNGVHLLDPTSPRPRRINGMVFSSNWLIRSGLLAKANVKRSGLHARINPSAPDRIYVELDDTGLQELSIQTDDPLLRELTLAEWLTVERGDRHFRATNSGVELNSKASMLKSHDETNKHGQAEKRREIAQLPSKPTKQSFVQDMGERTRRERAATSPHYMPNANDRAQESATTYRADVVSQSISDVMEEMRRNLESAD
jgi:hypothetical protein